ncbi:hypothetical protein HPB49_008567 [Dermacentor silvarum]|uniref:Uncharacterized protein n=1 Tax=Dermacentor silvarum TaxID=543639 RepID=A0ACB8DBV2_DERSI|nr:hypothetical protein HPB49_008567 [Dermacentor silvarum]
MCPSPCSSSNGFSDWYSKTSSSGRGCNEHVDAFNTLVKNTYATDSDPEHRVIRVRARDIFLGYANEEAMLKAQAKVAKMFNAQFANLPRQILLVVDKASRLSANIDVIGGLVSVDGAGGEEDFPRRLWLHFDGPATGKLARLRSTHAVSEASRLGYEVDSAWVPIEPRNITLTIDLNTGVACKRTQFPLVQASAITVHKSQGGTYATIVYGYAKTHPQKLVYVTLSCGRTVAITATTGSLLDVMSVSDAIERLGFTRKSSRITQILDTNQLSFSPGICGYPIRRWETIFGDFTAETHAVVSRRLGGRA